MNPVLSVVWTLHSHIFHDRRYCLDLSPQAFRTSWHDFRSQYGFIIDQYGSMVSGCAGLRSCFFCSTEAVHYAIVVEECYQRVILIMLMLVKGTQALLSSHSL